MHGYVKTGRGAGRHGVTKQGAALQHENKWNANSKVYANTSTIVPII